MTATMAIEQLIGVGIAVEMHKVSPNPGVHRDRCAGHHQSLQALYRKGRIWLRDRDSIGQGKAILLAVINACYQAATLRIPNRAAAAARASRSTNRSSSRCISLRIV